MAARAPSSISRPSLAGHERVAAVSTKPVSLPLRDQKNQGSDASGEDAIAQPPRKVARASSQRSTSVMPKSNKSVAPRESKKKKDDMALVERKFNVDMRCYRAKTSSARGPTAPAVPPHSIKSAPFHIWTKNLLLRHSLLRDPSLARRGCNRMITVMLYLPADAAPHTKVLIRFAKNPSKALASECRPLNLDIAINGSVALLKPGVVNYRAKYRPFYSPVEVSLQKLNGGAVNTLVIQWTVEEGVDPEQDFFLFIQLTKRKTIESLIQSIPSQSSKACIAKLYKTLNGQSADQSIIGDTRTLSLICPLSRKRMVVAVRGKACAHAECFDAASYLKMNESASAKWLCPRCNNCVPLDQLIVDEFVQELLSFTEDAAVEVVAQDKNIVIRLIKKEQPKINQVPLFEVIDLDDSVVVL